MQLIVERRGYRLLPLIALAMATMVLVFLAGNADAAPTGPFEIDKFAIAANGDPVPCAVAECPKKSYYSGNGELDSGDGKADDWAQGASNNGLFLPSAAAPHTATPTAPCYGSNVDFNPAITYTSRFICDGFTGIAGAPENSIVSPAGDIPKDIWPIKGSNNVTPKDDLSHGYFAQLSQDCSGTPHNIVVVGMERGNNEGSNHWGIELNAVAPTGLTTVAEGLSPAANFALNFNRVVGDVFISVDLERGGTEPGILVTQVSGFEPDLDATFVAASAAGECVGQFPAATTSTNLVEQLTPPWNTPVCDPTIVDDGPNSCRIANGLGTGPVNQGSSSCTVPGQSNTKIACTTLPGRDFVEVAIDLTAYGVARGCFADVLLSTRSAPPGTSTLPAVDLSGADIKDVTAAVLPPCAISWEKRDASLGSAGSHPLQGGATFTIAPNPDACDDANTTGPDDTSPVTIVDNSAPDADADAGQFSLPDICPATYTITETVAPSGYAADTDTTRVCSVSVIAPTCVIGSALTAPPSTDDEGTRDGSGNCTDNECDFHNRLGSVEWEKRNDLGALQAGATFSISPNPYACHSPAGTNPSPISDDADGTDGPAGNGDEDGTGGQLKLDRVCIGNYTITEATPPSGFALDDDTTRTCNVTATDLACAVGTQGAADDCPDSTPASDGDETDFCNRIGTIEWEKRDDQGVLQGGATFTVGPNPFDCHDGIIGNDTAAITVVDNSSPDADTDSGQLKLNRVCLGTYTITETVPPPGFALDDDPTRSITVSSTELNPVVGTQGVNDIGDTDESDFGNRLGTIEWEKRDDQGVLQGGATFTVGPNPFDCHNGIVGDDTAAITVKDNDPPDADPDAGQLKLERVCLGTYTITETVPPPGFALDDDPTRSITVSSTELNPVVGGQGTNDIGDTDEHDFGNRLGTIEWEKRDDQAELQGGATFTVGPNPFDCHDGIVGNDTAAITVVDNSAPDADPDAGQLKLNRVCLGTYTITETVPPPGFALDDDPTREIIVSATELNPVVGTMDFADCADFDTDESDFCNRLGTIEWEKRDDQGVLQGGATFTVGPNPFDCHNGIVGDETAAITVVDNSAPDVDSDSGQLKLDRVCLGTYTITETVPPDGFALDDDPTREIIVSSTELNPVVGEQGTNDLGDTDEHDFGNRLGTIEWEKRDDQGVLQGGATFTVGPNPFDCHNGIVGDDTAAITVKDNDPPDADPDAGQLKLERVCLGTYTITETVPPDGFALDDDPTREIIVSSTELNPVVGEQGTNDLGDTDEHDFGNRLGTIEWEKRDDQGVLQGGATFTVGPNPFDCHNGIVGDDTAAITVKDNDPPDADPDAGQLKLERVCLGTYTITETVPPDGFALDDDPTREIIVSSTELNPVVGEQGTNDLGDTDEHDFGNRLGTIEWEKRDDQGVLQGGATFTVGPNPFDCHNGIVGDDTAAITVKDNDPPDADPDAGQLKLERVCLGTYTITETVPPDGFALDDDPTREIIVSSTELNPVVGEQGTNDLGDTDEHDFGNRLGTIEWEKRDDQGVLQGGATFTVLGAATNDPGGTSDGPFACQDTNTTDDDEANPVTVLDNSAPDVDLDDGQFKLDRVCLGTYTICESAAPSGFARDDSLCRSITVSSTELNPVIGEQGANDCADDIDADEQDFCNRLGSLEWEKRSDINGDLLAGATFEVSPNPFACRGAGSDPLVVTDDVSSDLPDTDLVDEDDDGGQFKLSRVCMGTYTITETVPPATFAEDPDDTRTCEVDDPTFLGGSDELNCVVGSPLLTPPDPGDPPTGNDGCPDTNDADGDDVAPGSDFCNLIGSLYWEKRGKDASTPETGNELLAGFGFTVTGTDVNVVVTDCTAGPCPAGGDQNPDGGKFCLDEMPIGVLLTIDETSKVPGYIQTAPENDGDLTANLTASSTCAGTPTDAGDFINQPLSQFKIDFICLALSPTGSGECATKAKITCPTPAISPTPDDATPDDFDDISETYGNAVATLLEGTYDCTIVIDP